MDKCLTSDFFRWISEIEKKKYFFFIFNSPAFIWLFSWQIFSETKKFLIIKNWQKFLTQTILNKSDFFEIRFFKLR